MRDDLAYLLRLHLTLIVKNSDVLLFPPSPILGQTVADPSELSTRLTLWAHVPWYFYQAGARIDVLVTCMLALATSDERHRFLFVFRGSCAVEPLGLRDTSFACASHRLSCDTAPKRVSTGGGSVQRIG